MGANSVVRWEVAVFFFFFLIVLKYISFFFFIVLVKKNTRCFESKGGKKYMDVK